MDEEIIVKVEPIDLSDEETQQSENPNSGNEFDLFGICKVEKEEPLFDETPATAGDEAGTSPQPHSSTAPYSNNMIFLKEEGSDNFYPEESYEEEADDFDSSNYASKGWGSHSELNHPGIKEDEEMNVSLQDQEENNTENQLASRLSDCHKTNVERDINSRHQGELAFACSLCEYKCCMESDLTIHIARFHESTDENSKYSCSRCNNEVSHEGIQRDVHEDLYCSHCDFKFNTKEDLRGHIITTHEENNVFYCPSCDYKSKTVNHLKIHFANLHVRILDSACPYCNYKCIDERNLTVHIVQVHAPIEAKCRYSCSFCDYETNYKSSLKNHVASMHEKKMTFSCSHCRYRCNSKPNLRRHNKIHGARFKYSCPLCAYEIKNLNYLNRHVATVHVKKLNLSCPLCRYKCRQEIDLTTHVVEAHARVDPNSEYSCSQCDYKVSDKSFLRKHIASVHDKKRSAPFTICDKCNLNKVLERHDAKNKYFCPICDDYKSKTLNHLKIHVAYKHVKKLNLTCSLCGYKCSAENDLTIHIVQDHESEKNFIYSCSQCHFEEGCKCVTKEGTIKSSCPTCKHKTLNKNNLERHITSVHYEN